MNNKSCLALFFIFLIAISGYMYVTTPSVDIDDFTAKKHIETTKYSSGKVEKDYFIDFSYTILDSKFTNHDILGEIKIYGKKGKLIHESSFSSGDGVSDHDYQIDVSKKVFKKAKKIELILYNYDKSIELFHDTIKIKKGKNTKSKIDDSDWYTPSKSSSSSSSYSDSSYSSSSDYSSSSYSSGSDYGDYGSYIGNSNTHKFHESSCSWADNIKSSNVVTFSSRQDAIDSGYSPCKHCNP